MQPTASRTTTSSARADALLREAFRDLHGTRLHAFALLMTLGDRARAAHLAGEALEAGAAKTDDLRHPERAAAWLRARVVRGARRGRGRRDLDKWGRLAALFNLGVDQATLAALSGMRPLERAALVAAVIEGFDLRDVATIVGRSGPGVDSLLRRARRTYNAREIDLDAIPLPAFEGPVAPARPVLTPQMGRFAVGAAAVSILVVASVTRLGAPVAPISDREAQASGSRGEGVLGGRGGPSRAASPSPDGTEEASPTSTSSASPTPSPLPTFAALPPAPAQTPNSTFAAGPPPPVVTSPPAATAPPRTPVPTTNPTATPVVTPSPTLSLPPLPTATPTLEPTPVPSSLPSPSLPPGSGSETDASTRHAPVAI